MEYTKDLEAPNLNTGKPWSDWDDDDIRTGVEIGRSDEETAIFLCRKLTEIKTRLKELGFPTDDP